ncbi:hypothetical protein E2562_037621 [Oryza meyeriana var. granulata]|uniref:MATH domain-containing protein n=1 Tax=Oryza meyeriana var. granulata TaxID=110450 RepID=A0A6G1CCI1_9ORYZ|nr:hypothetical protein E2562_037621 [Oryza meyeriana var. granulata]
MSIATILTPSPPSASTIALTATTGCHLLKIERYSHARLLGNGKYLKSAKFKAAGHTWRILFYPNNKFRTDGDTISLKLQLVDRSKDVTAEIKFSMLHRCHTDETSGPYNHWKIRHTFKTGRYNKCGINWFVGTNELEKPHYKYIEQDDDSIVVQCNIKVLNKPDIHGHSLEKLGLICHCEDDTCNRLHDIWPAMSVEPGVNCKGAFIRLFSCFVA